MTVTTFEVDKDVPKVARSIQNLFLALSLYGFSVPLWDGPLGTTEQRGLWLFSALLAGLAWIFRRYGRRVADSDIEVDGDGLWYRQLGKDDGLVPWSEIYSIRERWGGRRLDLCDEYGRTLLKLSFYLQQRDRLRRRIAKKVAQNLRRKSLAERS